jgi:DNA-directed RNA polymerase subunit RPC12/RpoP
MAEYECYLCKKKKDINGDLLSEVGEDEVLLCPECANVVERLTGLAGREVEIGE